jgi:hypothetical protein
MHGKLQVSMRVTTAEGVTDDGRVDYGIKCTQTDAIKKLRRALRRSRPRAAIEHAMKIPIHFHCHCQIWHQPDSDSL